MGDPVDEICKTALLSPDPLLIMASHKRGRLESWFKGSVAEAVLRHTTAPVLVIKDSTEPVDPQQTAHFHKILVPVDGSELAGEILPLVEHLALMFGASVVLYFDDRGGGEADDQPPPEVRPQSHLHRYAEQLREKGINVAMDSSTHESPAKGILACAETHSVDLIAMCTHGYSGIVQGIYGSVAHQVLESANCPLLLQRSRLATENLILEDMFVTG
jgi:nucleotide-binding universal stress UspA family protein